MGEIDERASEIFGNFAGVGSDTKFTTPPPTPWLNIFVADTLVPDTYSENGGMRWLVGYRPVRRVVQGQGFWSQYYAYSTSDRSKLGMFLPAVKKVTGPVSQVGSGELIGRVCWCVTQRIKMGRNEDGTVKEYQLYLPVTKASPEEIEEARNLAPLDAGVFDQSQHQGPSYDETTIPLMIEVLNGRTAIGAVKYLGNIDIDETIKAAIMGGQAAEYLIENGYLVFDGKEYHKVG